MHDRNSIPERQLTLLFPKLRRSSGDLNLPPPAGANDFASYFFTQLSYFIANSYESSFNQSNVPTDDIDDDILHSHRELQRVGTFRKFGELQAALFSRPLKIAKSNGTGPIGIGVLYLWSLIKTIPQACEMFFRLLAGVTDNSYRESKGFFEKFGGGILKVLFNFTANVIGYATNLADGLFAIGFGTIKFIFSLVAAVIFPETKFKDVWNNFKHDIGSAIKTVCRHALKLLPIGVVTGACIFFPPVVGVVVILCSPLVSLISTSYDAAYERLESYVVKKARTFFGTMMSWLGFAGHDRAAPRASNHAVPDLTTVDPGPPIVVLNAPAISAVAIIAPAPVGGLVPARAAPVNIADLRLRPNPSPDNATLSTADNAAYPRAALFSPNTTALQELTDQERNAIHDTTQQYTPRNG